MVLDDAFKLSARDEVLQRPDIRKTGIHPNFWYPVARSDNVKTGKPHGVSFAGEPIVLVRTERGTCCLFCSPHSNDKVLRAWVPDAILSAQHPSNEDYWRGIVLLGRNVATYKLALAKSVLELAPAGKTFITMEELAVPYAHHLAEHLKKAEKQITSSRSQFLDTCRKFNLQDGGVSQNQLVESAVRLGFNNVIDAFHVVNNAPIPHRFYVDERKSKDGITLTDTLLQLVRQEQAANFPLERSLSASCLDQLSSLRAISKHVSSPHRAGESKM